MGQRIGNLCTRSEGFVQVRVAGPALPEGADVWWRADDKRYANYDPWVEYEQPSGSHLVLELTPYVLVRHTPKGVWLRSYFGTEIFVLGTATRQQAVPTMELAIRDLVARKQRHVQGCQARLQRAQAHLEAAEKWLEKETGQ
jgi:hypothetical protein